jgi:tRNA pseudouridine55 synthase
LNAPRSRIAWRRIDGVLLLDKPLGLSSNDALQKARRLIRAEKGGHTGTLDPLASGLLPLCFGEATKFAHDLLDAAKCYETTLRLGIRTVSGDADGAVVDERPVEVTMDQIEAAVSAFTGDILQIPPMHSALKRDGVPLYKLARQGIEVDRVARPVTLHSISVLAVELPYVSLRVHCSKGTYIRTLGQDIGEHLGCGAHLSSLRRVAVASLSIAQALSLEALAGAVERGEELQLLASPDSLISELPAVRIDPVAYSRFSHGNSVDFSLPPGERFRVYSPDAVFLGVAIRAPDGRLQPQRLIRTDTL